MNLDVIIIIQFFLKNVIELSFWDLLLLPIYFENKLLQMFKIQTRIYYRLFEMFSSVVIKNHC